MVEEHVIRGEAVSDEQILAWADETEAGHDVAELPRPRPGRPPVGGLGVVVPVRLDTDTIGALMTRAEADGLATCPDAIRAAVREWLRGG